jgi:hypothetical protein
MSTDKKSEQFKSFQIGNMLGNTPGTGPAIPPPSHAYGVSSASAGRSDPNAAPNERGNFPFLEELIEADDQLIMDFGQEMGQICTHLDELIAKRTGRVKTEAMQARKAYDLTFNMIDHLREVKAGLLNPQASE